MEKNNVFEVLQPPRVLYNTSEHSPSYTPSYKLWQVASLHRANLKELIQMKTYIKWDIFFYTNINLSVTSSG